MSKIKAGKLLCVDQGQYSDYQVMGFFVVCLDFNPLDELVTYMGEHPEQKNNYKFESTGFLNFLHKKGYLLEIDYSTLYLSGYSNWKEVEINGKTIQTI